MYKKISGLLIIFSFTIALLLGNILYGSKNAAAASDVTLAGFTFNKSDGSAADTDLNDTYKTNATSGYFSNSGIYASFSKFYASVSGLSSDNRKLEWSKDNDYTYNGAAVASTPIIEASIKHPWGTSPYFLIQTSTLHYENIKLAVRIGGSKKAPKSFKVQYSTDGKSYSDLSGIAFSLSSNKVLYAQNLNLPSSVDNLSTVYIRIIISGTATISGGDITNEKTGGELAINNIIVSGTKINENKPTTAPKSTQKPDSGSTAGKKNKASDTNANNKSSDNKNDSKTESQNINGSTNDSKILAAPTLTSYKKGSRIIKGKAVKKSTVTIKVGKNKYTVKLKKKSFTVKLKTKLKKGTVIKVSAKKSGYKKSPAKSYTVK